jgi:toxin ParE1/3/4
MRVEYSLAVEDDLDEIAAYIAVDNPRRAVTFIREIRAEIDRIGQGPQLYQLRPEVGEDARLAVVAAMSSCSGSMATWYVSST